MYQWQGKGGQSWGSWSPQLPRNSGKGRGRGKDTAKEKPKADGGLTKPYDSTALPSASAASGGEVENNLFKDFMEFVKENKLEIPDKFKKHLPDTTKEDIKMQQKRLNRYRTVVNRIENKKKAIEKDKERWTVWLASIKEEIVCQKKKHQDAQTQLEQELVALVEEEKKLRLQGDNEEMDQHMEEEDMEALVDELLDEDGQKGSDQQKREKEKALIEMQKNMELRYMEQQKKESERAVMEMQQDMERQYLARLEEEKAKMQVMFLDMKRQMEERKGVMEISDSEDPPKTTVPGIGATLISTQLGNPKTPFGVQRVPKQKQVSSPYGGREKEDNQNSGQAQKEHVKMQEINEDKKPGKLDTGQTGQ